VVVDLGDGRVIARRITFSEADISGLQALKLTGLDLSIADFDFGAAVCSVEQVGCPVDNCFCDSDLFWGYQHLEEGSWQAYQVGAADSAVAGGAVEGWLWGPFDAALPQVTQEYLAAQAALQWLHTQQAGTAGPEGDLGATLDTLMAVEAAGQQPGAWRFDDGRSLLDVVRSQAATFAVREESRASAGKLALAVAAAGLDPQHFAGLNLLGRMQQLYDPASGAFGTSNWDQALSMLGWRAAGEAVPAAAADLLAGRINPDGGWAWTASGDSDVDSTAVAIQALLAAGRPVSATEIISGLAYLQAAQNGDGGLPYSPGSPTDTSSNANSTAYTIQALLAAGQDPAGPQWTMGDNSLAGFLLGQQLPDGALGFQGLAPDQFATRQAIPALMGQTLLRPSPAVALRRGVAWLAAQQQPDGSFAGFNPGATLDGVLALVLAAPHAGLLDGDQGSAALAYLAGQAADYSAQGASAAGKLLATVAAAGGDVRDFGGVDLLAAIRDTYAPDGTFGGGSTWDQAWSILGLAAARQTVPLSATQVLEGAQLENGGWGFEAQAEAADVDSTALALQALAAAGRDAADPAVAAGLVYLHAVQNRDGGLPGYDGSTSASSTGLALQALAAWGQKTGELRWAAPLGDTASGAVAASPLLRPGPLDALLGLQSDQGGFAGFSGPDDPFSTYQALPGIAAAPYSDLARAGMALRGQRALRPLVERLVPLCRSAAVLPEPALAALCEVVSPP
jgi:prenyltransferase beta subunit